MKTKALFRGNKKTIKLYKQGKKYGVMVIPDDSFITKQECKDYEAAKELFEQLTQEKWKQ